ncbi:Non-specific serine/threonine protein kinase [Bertholletia excelsa]
MSRNSIWVIFALFSFSGLLNTAKTADEEVRISLINFYRKLSDSNGPPHPGSGWNLTSEPCKDHWMGVVCDNRGPSVKKIYLDGLNLAGTFDARVLCNSQSLASSLTVLSLSNNSLGGENLEHIPNCGQLMRLLLGGNRFSGDFPDSVSKLNNLKLLDISGNNFSGKLSDLARISGLQELFAQNNQLTGPIPNFDFQNFAQFNVSFNNLVGQIPSGGDIFPASSFMGNPQLCGIPLPNKCSSSDYQANKSKEASKNDILMFLGYFILGFIVLFGIILKLCGRGKKKEEKIHSVHKVVSSEDDSLYKPSITSSEYEPSLSKSGVSAEGFSDSGMVSSSLVILTRPEVNGMKLDDLLQAPAELLGRGKQGTVYKVTCDGGKILAVKRIRDWTISSSEFRERMRRLDQVKHRNVLPTIAFYCSSQEKLLVYEYQENGSLFRLLHGSQTGRPFYWSSRLATAASLATALSFMHQELRDDGISHGNLKSSNILLNHNMEPCIAEYGLTASYKNEDYSSSEVDGAFRADIYAFGAILLELLTGKLVQSNGTDLVTWVLSVLKEQWTVEVFDKNLIREGASEERMVNLLQIAVKCVNRSPEYRPSINQVAFMINTLKEEEERSMSISIVSEPWQSKK